MNELFQTLNEKALRLDDDWWRVLKTSIPYHELDDDEAFYSGLQKNICSAIAFKIDNQTVGTAYFQNLKKPDITFLTYLAVDEKYRGKNIGSKLLEELFRACSKSTPFGLILGFLPFSLKSAVKADFLRSNFLVNFGSFLFRFSRNSYVFLQNLHKNRSKFPQKLRQKDLGQALKKTSSPGIVAEVESPEEADDEADFNLRVARISFYEKRGFRLICRNYFHPPLHQKKDPIPMYLMFRGNPKDADDLEQNLAQRKKLIEAMYFQKYSLSQGFSKVDDNVLHNLLNHF